jgi:hypothetical protein
LADWIAQNCEYDWNSARSGVQGRHDWNGICDNDLWRQHDQLRHMLLNQLRIGPDKPIFDLNVASFDPPQIAHTQPECIDSDYRFGVIFGKAKQHADPPHLLRPLRPRRERPRRRDAEERDELAPLHVPSARTTPCAMAIA